MQCIAFENKNLENNVEKLVIIDDKLLIITITKYSYFLTFKIYRNVRKLYI